MQGPIGPLCRDGLGDARRASPKLGRQVWACAVFSAWAVQYCMSYWCSCPPGAVVLPGQLSYLVSCLPGQLSPGQLSVHLNDYDILNYISTFTYL